MRKIIKVTPECEVSTHSFPAGTIQRQNRILRELIGGGCSTIERVSPVGLIPFNSGKDIYSGDQMVIMLVDEEFLLHDTAPQFNWVGSYLYGAHQHGCPILGNILLVAEEMERGEITFVGMEEELYREVYAVISRYAEQMKDWEEKDGRDWV
jgi:hypothetical protein